MGKPQWIAVKNYKRYQHYKDRNPPWVKLYWDLLSDEDFIALTMVDRGLYCHFLLLASRHENHIKFDLNYIRLQFKLDEIPDLSALFQKKFLLARCYHLASKTLPQRESTEKEKKEPDKSVVHTVDRGDKSRPRIPGEAEWHPIGEQLARLRKGGP